MEVNVAYFEGTEASTSGAFAPSAFGGGIGIASGRCKVRDATLNKTRTTSAQGGRGGGVGVFAGTLELMNVSIEEASTSLNSTHGTDPRSDWPHGRSIDLMAAAQFESTFLSIVDDESCDASTKLINSRATTPPVFRAFKLC